ncbi:hypothetical protein ATCV1_z065R [Acanthocystis turfacea chlorella virus 1]|uniref:Uncharacterized protein z065R n=1 Tax=Chlorovirus heliozoae TaxID=322019 RepID=A7K825_9PHYC|nr:hypothetical protein ATCV1_z065R [Acanthocystis turfacea chlorella virus 1]ABT16199.1 hypothetical protein ATCV1_z065R [Acanthocystis turfacea chlorella virus 1]
MMMNSWRPSWWASLLSSFPETNFTRRRVSTPSFFPGKTSYKYRAMRNPRTLSPRNSRRSNVSPFSSKGL